MGGTSKKGNTDIFNNQPLLLIVLVDTIKLYKIKKIIQVEKNKIKIINTIKVLSNNSSNNKNNGNPLPNTGDKGQNDFKDHIYKEEENNFNTIFFRCIYIYISPIYLIQILSQFKTNYFFSLNSSFN